MEVSTSTAALGFSIVIVLMLLMSCRDNKPRSCANNKPSSCANNKNTEPLKQPDVKVSSVCEDKKSAWGSGVHNRKSMARRDDVAQNLESYDDYNEVAMYEALDPAVAEGQMSYAADIGVSNSGASAMTIRSDDQDIVPWVGLRRPNYQAVYAECDARVQPSQFADQMPTNREFRLY